MAAFRCSLLVMSSSGSPQALRGDVSDRRWFPVAERIQCQDVDEIPREWER